MSEGSEGNIAKEITTSAYAINLGLTPEAVTQYELKPSAFDRIPATLPPSQLSVFEKTKGLIDAIQARDRLVPANEPRRKFMRHTDSVIPIKSEDYAELKTTPEDVKEMVEEDIRSKKQQFRKGEIILTTQIDAWEHRPDNAGGPSIKIQTVPSESDTQYMLTISRSSVADNRFHDAVAGEIVYISLSENGAITLRDLNGKDVPFTDDIAPTINKTLEELKSKVDASKQAIQTQGK